MLNEPVGLRPRLGENSPSLPAGSPLTGCSAVVSFGHWVLDGDRGRRKSRKPAVAYGVVALPWCPILAGSPATAMS